MPENRDISYDTASNKIITKEILSLVFYHYKTDQVQAVTTVFHFFTHRYFLLPICPSILLWYNLCGSKIKLSNHATGKRNNFHTHGKHLPHY